MYIAHGGGMLTGNNRLGLDQALDWAGELGMVVVPVAYRAAPESTYSAAIEDCFTSLSWLASSGLDYAIDRS
jgi:acetyl esterase/lipase